MDELGVNRNLPVLRLNRVSTGISQFDIMLDGGYKNPATVAILGPTGPERRVFAFHFVSAGIQAGDKILYITTDRTPDELEKLAGEFGISIKSDLVKYLDCYSLTVSTQAPAVPRPNIVQISSPSALNELSLAINEALEQMQAKRLRVVFHSFSTLGVHSQQDSLFKFLSLVDGRLKNANATTLLLVDEGMHDEKFLTILRHAVDEEFRIRVSEGAKVVSSPELPLEVPIRVGPLGVEVD
ncbi:MAG: RAD55 family ATPase [Candidatus Micrarchaeota archaeon]